MIKGFLYKFAYSANALILASILCSCADGAHQTKVANCVYENSAAHLVSDSGYFKLNNFQSTGKIDRADFSCSLKLPKFKQMWFASADCMYSGFFPYIANRMNPWITEAKFSDEFEKSPSQDAVYQGSGRNGQYALLKLSNGKYMALLPLTVGDSMAWLYADKDNVLKLKASNFGTQNLSGDLPLMVWSTDENPYKAVADVWKMAANVPEIKGKMRLIEEKQYPEQFKYLGWCSWEQYHKNISSDLLCEVVDNIKKSGVPIRWILVDDGFQVEEKLRLKSFAPDAKRFPQAWKPLLDKRDDQIKWFGLWHCYYGLWNGIDAVNDFGELNNSLVKISDKVLMPGKSEADANFTMLLSVLWPTTVSTLSRLTCRLDLPSILKIVPIPYAPITGVLRRSNRLVQSV